MDSDYENVDPIDRIMCGKAKLFCPCGARIKKEDMSDLHKSYIYHLCHSLEAGYSLYDCRGVIDAGEKAISECGFSEAELQVHK
ncbi:hypothetical protein Ciccas_014132 [Cichlidogyrus casuarinus]|uniref:Uncharacterized protein n=1 Tax=Cichlidogyrus casuarinus TaxID=1844966 RepID=A0ABD2PJL8_9PLAT